MIFSTSLPRFKAFLGESSLKASDLACCLLFLTPFLLPTARRSVAAAARAVLADVRDATWLLRWLGASKAPAALLAAAQHRLLATAAGAADRLHVLVVDSTQHGQQGHNTQNTFSRGNTKPRPKQSSRKQKPVHRRSCHCFVFALLLTPHGLRIPYWLPFYTEEHCALFERQHLSQASLAAQLIDGIPLPAGSRVVVVGDTAFEAKQVRQACARRGWSWVVPLNPERRLAGPAPRPQVRGLYKQLTASDFRKVSFRLDQGDLADLARVSPKRSQSRTHARTYWVHHRIAAVHNVGQVALLFSTKNEPTTPGGVQVQKVLISDAVSATAEELLRWYALRWQIELFFKEMKSELGMCQYKLGPFQRVVGWVNLSVVAFCYLEWYRQQKQQEAPGPDQPYWQRLRTAGLKEKVRGQVQRADLEEVLRLAGTAAGQERLQAVLDRISDDPAATAA
jgi:hypothetical protein